MALEDLTEITVTVTSADGSRTKVYRVRLGPEEAAGPAPEEAAGPAPEEAAGPASCLRGAVNVGFSLVVYEGGSCRGPRGLRRGPQRHGPLRARRRTSTSPTSSGRTEAVNREFRDPARRAACQLSSRVPVRAVDGLRQLVPTTCRSGSPRPAPGQDRCVVSLRGAGAGRLHSAALRPLAVGHAPHPRRGGGPPRAAYAAFSPSSSTAAVRSGGFRIWSSTGRARGGHRCLEGPACGAEHAGVAAGAAQGLTIGAARGWPRNESAHGLQPCRLRGRERRRARGLRGEPPASVKAGCLSPESTNGQANWRRSGGVSPSC